MSWIDRLRRALAIDTKPHDRAQVLEHALAMHEGGDIDGACALYRDLLRRDPRDADALHLTGLAAHQRGEQPVALELIDRALVSRPEAPRFHFNRGNVLGALGRSAEAEASFRRATELDPAHAPSWYNLGGTQMRLEKHVEAASSLRQAFALAPDLPDLRHSLAQALANSATHTLDPTAQYAEAATLLWGHWPQMSDALEARLLLAYTLQQSRQWARAAEHYQGILQTHPDHEGAHNNLANCFNQMGRVREAIVHYREVARLSPTNALAGSAVVACMNYDERMDPAMVLAEHQSWAARFAPASTKPLHSLAYANPVKHRLRIAYVSADLRRHPVATLFAPVIEHHDRDRFEVFCFYNYPTEDTVSQRLRRASDQWINIHAINDSAFAARLAADGIDILVDLSGHTSYGRLPAYAARPAPVQISWLGYFNSTGMAQMDAFISDVHSSPPGQDKYFSERLIRLPHTRFPFEPHEFYPKPNSREDLLPGAVTFGSLHNLAKLNDKVLRTWGKILRQLPESKLLLQANALDDEINREWFLGRCVEAGLARERLIVRPWARLQDSALAYHDVDIALDPFPFCGGMTSFDALWMGIPIVTLTGDTVAARQTTSMLANIDLLELAAHDVDNYAEVAVALARDPKRLTTFRKSLRSRVAASALCDYPGFTRGLESAYLSLWNARQWPSP